MAEISRLLRFLDGVQRGVDISTNTLVVGDLKVGGSAGTSLAKSQLDKLLLIHNAADADGTFDSQYADIAHVSNTSNPHSVTKSQILSGNLIVNADIDAAAAIAYSKLDLADSIVNADISASAAIAESKLSLDYATSTLNTNINSAQSQIDAHEDGTASKHDASEIDVETAGNYTTAADLETNLSALDSQIKTNADDISAIVGSGMDFKGGLDASNLGSQLDNAEKGDFYVATTAGTIFGTNAISLNVGDNIIAKQDITGTPDDGSAWAKIDNTEANDILRNGDLASAQIFVGNGSGIATAVAMSGDIAIDSSGGTSIQSGVITNDMIDAAAAIAYSKLDLADSIVNADISASAAIAYGKLDLADSIVNADISASAAIATSKLADSSELSEAVTFFGSTDLSAAEAEQLSDESNADSLHKHSVSKEEMTAGETFSASSLVAVRAYLDGETEGQIYKAEKDTSVSDQFWAIGLVYPSSEVSASGSIEVVKSGKMTVSSHGFSAGQLYLDASGAITQTAPGSNGDAVVSLGSVIDSNTIEVKIQVMYVV